MYVYLAGPLEIKDTWRKETIKKLKKIDMIGIDPSGHEHLTRAENGDIIGDIPYWVCKNQNEVDLESALDSGGFAIFNLNTSAEGRKPTSSLMELQWAVMSGLPLIIVLDPEKAEPEIVSSPWIKTSTKNFVKTIDEALDIVASRGTCVL